MIGEKSFVDFIIIGVLVLSFSGFYLYKMSMMRKLHENILIPRLTLGFHLLGKTWVHICYACDKN